MISTILLFLSLPFKHLPSPGPTTRHHILVLTGIDTSLNALITGWEVVRVDQEQGFNLQKLKI